MFKVNYPSTAHCLMKESYSEKGPCLMDNLTLSRLSSFQITVVANRCLIGIHPLTHRTSYSSFPHDTSASPTTHRESEGRCSSAGVQGEDPLVTAKRAASLAWRDEERFGERKGTHRNAWFPSSLQHQPSITTARSSETAICPLTPSCPHCSSNVTSRC